MPRVEFILEIYQKLTVLQSFDRWTVNWFLTRRLGRQEVFPAGYLVVRKSMQNHYFNGKNVSRSAQSADAEPAKAGAFSPLVRNVPLR